MAAHEYRAKDTGIYSIRDLQEHYERVCRLHGREGHWFEPGTMRFFKSRIAEPLVYGLRLIYFFSSEKGPNLIRRYSIRAYDPIEGTIETVGLGFQGYKTLAAAKRAARYLSER